MLLLPTDTGEWQYTVSSTASLDLCRLFSRYGSSLNFLLKLFYLFLDAALDVINTQIKESSKACSGIESTSRCSTPQINYRTG